MTEIMNPDITRLRLRNQLIAERRFDKPDEVVGWLGAVQAQDYLGGLWAVGLRMNNATEAIVEQAIADRKIVRTWPMRGTLHFVAAADVRWMLGLLTPRVIAGSTNRLLRDYGLDDATYTRSRELLFKALQGGKQLTRNAMYEVLEAGDISRDGQRHLHILGRLSQEGLICLASRQGKQPTFALLDEWVPLAVSRRLERDEALAELAGRYFTSHGPATLQDFAWWSGLRISDARAGLEMTRSRLCQEVAGEKTYWMGLPVPPAKDTQPKVTPNVQLLPPFDEYTVAYKDRSALVDRVDTDQLGTAVLGPTIVVDGQIVGTWKRSFEKNSAIVRTHPLVTLSDAENRAITAAARRYGEFLGVPVILPQA